MQYLSPPVRLLWGTAGDHFIVPRTPFRMATIAIHIRPSSNAGLCPICSILRLTERKASSKRYKGNPGGLLHAALATGSNGETQHAASLRGGAYPGWLRASIALPDFGYQMSGLERPQWNGDKNKDKKDQAENREPLPLGIERRDLIPWTGIGAPHKEN